MLYRLFAACLLVAAPSTFAALAPQPAPRYREGELIVKYRADAPVAAKALLKARLGLKARSTLLRGRAELLELPRVTTVEAARKLLSADPAVEYAEPNYLRFKRAVTPNDPLFGNQYGLGDAYMDLRNAWNANRTGDGSVVVAVVDDGVLTTHEDLVDNIVPGRDFVNNDDNPNPDTSEDFHGTLVAGCIGAVGNNSKGIAGIAWDVGLMPLKFGFDVETEVLAFEHAAANPNVRIINASFGGPDFAQAEFDAIQALMADGILLVAAAGNLESNLDYSVLSYPANHDLPNIVAVAATNFEDEETDFTQHGAVAVDVSAPGKDVATTDVGGGYVMTDVTGTSFSAPYVAGIAALIEMHANPADFREVKARLIEGAEPLPGLRTAGGRVNAANALALTAQPSLVIRKVELVNEQEENERMDPGETLSLHFTLDNLWAAASNVVATLSADGGVTVNTAQVNVPTIDANGQATVDFDLSVASLSGHREVLFTLNLRTEDGSYNVNRGYRAEIAELLDGVTANGVMQRTPYDEFHTWHFDVPSLSPGANTITFESSSGTDIDLLIKRGSAPHYEVVFGAAQYFHDADAIGGDASGNERVVINGAQTGTYYVTVVNYAQAINNGYTLRATVSTPPPPPPPRRRGGGGGFPAPSLLGGLLIGVWWRARPRLG